MASRKTVRSSFRAGVQHHLFQHKQKLLAHCQESSAAFCLRRLWRIPSPSAKLAQSSLGFKPRPQYDGRCGKKVAPTNVGFLYELLARDARRGGEVPGVWGALE